jgi:hypothetical protein
MAVKLPKLASWTMNRHLVRRQPKIVRTRCPPVSWSTRTRAECSGSVLHISTKSAAPWTFVAVTTNEAVM